MIIIIGFIIWSILGFWSWAKLRLISHNCITLGDLFKIILTGILLGPSGFIFYFKEKGLFDKPIYETKERREYIAKRDEQIREERRRREPIHIPEDTFRIQ
jgi:hypothetical protein